MRAESAGFADFLRRETHPQGCLVGSAKNFFMCSSPSYAPRTCSGHRERASIGPGVSVFLVVVVEDNVERDVNVIRQRPGGVDVSVGVGVDEAKRITYSFRLTLA